MKDSNTIFEKRSNTFGGTDPISFPVEINTDLRHQDCPGGINVRASLLIKLHPEHQEFRTWASHKIAKDAALSDLICLLQNDEVCGLVSYLQRLINEVENIGLVLRYGKEAVGWARHKDVLPEWIEIENLQYFNAKVLQTEDERQREEFQKKEQLLQQQRQMDEMAAENEAAKKEIAARAKLAELKHQNDIKNENLEQEIKSLQYELEKKRLEKLSELLLRMRWLTVQV